MKNLFFLLLVFFEITSHAQDSLPSFSVNNKGSNRIVVEWLNNYKQIKQISIQRSSDSLTNYKTISTVPDPMNRENGYLDNKAPDNNMFYRLYLVFDGGNFLFTNAKRPAIDTVDINVLARIIEKDEADSVLSPEEEQILKKYNKSSLLLSKESSEKEKNNSTLKGNKPEITTTNYRIISNQSGQVKIVLTDFVKKKYAVKFFEEDDTFLFEIKEIKQPVYMLDKSTFLHSGWFKFEIYDNGKLVEKHQFFIPKD